MKCPYCEEQVGAQVKYCPKCGLPVGDEVTVMGTGVLGDRDVSPWVWAAGALAVLLVAIGIGWATRGGEQAARPGSRELRQTVPVYPAAASSPGSQPAISPSTWGTPASAWSGGSIVAPPITAAVPLYNSTPSASPPIPASPSAKKVKKPRPVQQAPATPLFSVMRAQEVAPRVAQGFSGIPPAPPKIRQHPLPYWYYSQPQGDFGAPNSGGMGGTIGGGAAPPYPGAPVTAGGAFVSPLPFDANSAPTAEEDSGGPVTASP